MPDSLASIDTASVGSADSYDIDEEERIAEEEWNESVAQLQNLVSMVLLPVVGKWMGRKWFHWAFARYLRLGFGQSFFLGERVLSI